MTLGLPLLGILIFIVGLQLLAGKWNVATVPNQVRATGIAIVAAIPFLWIYPLCSSTWIRLLGVASQVTLTFILVLTIVFYRFWRDPERISVENQGVIISPADGEVIYVREIPKDTVALVSKDRKDYLLSELIGFDLDTKSKGVIIIGIEMNIMNVHVNRCPIAGSVKLVKHIQGNFYSLRKKEAPFLNTRCTTLISNQVVDVAIVQIASRLVRRVDNFLSKGQTVCLGQRLGMIRFGSQVAVVIPNRDEVRVQAFVGQVTLAGVTVLARIKDH